MASIAYSLPTRNASPKSPAALRVKNIHRRLGKHCYMALRGWVSLQRLFIEHSRALGLKMSDFLAITCILNEQEKYGYGDEGEGANFTKIAGYAPISTRDLTECVKRLESLQLVSIWRRPGKPSLFNFAPLYERCWEFLTDAEREEASAIWKAMEAERKQKAKASKVVRQMPKAAASTQHTEPPPAPTSTATGKEPARQAECPNDEEFFWQQGATPVKEPTLEESLDTIAQLLGECDTDRPGSLRRIQAAQTLAGWSEDERDICLFQAAEQARARARYRRQGFFLRDFERRAFDVYDQAKRAAAVQEEQEREWAAILAIPLSEKAQRCEALLRERDWPVLRIPGMRLFSGERDWLWLLHLNSQDETLLDAVLAQLAPDFPSDAGHEPEMATLIDQANAAKTSHEETPPPCVLEQTSILSGEAPDHTAPPICEEAPINWAALALSPQAETLRQRLAADHWRALIVPEYGGVRRERGWYSFFTLVQDERIIACAAEALTKRQAEETQGANQQRRSERGHAARAGTMIEGG